MSPRLMVVCLGGLAGAGALVCCDMDEGVEALEAAPEERPATEDGAGEDQPSPAAAEAQPVH